MSKVKILHNWILDCIFHHSILMNDVLSSLALYSTPLSPTFTGKNDTPSFESFSGMPSYHDLKMGKVMMAVYWWQMWHFYPMKLMLQNFSIDNLYYFFLEPEKSASKINYTKDGCSNFWSAIKNLPEPNGYNMELYLSFCTNYWEVKKKNAVCLYKNQVASIKPVLTKCQHVKGRKSLPFRAIYLKFPKRACEK